MKIRILLIAALIVVGLSKANAQTITFTWNGSTDSSQLVNFATINGQPVNPATGYNGAIQITNGDFLWELMLPQSLLSNRGSLQCIVPITWGERQWGLRTDRSTMDGTKAGDWYTIIGSATCGESWNSAAKVPVSLTEYHVYVQYHSCYRGCRTWLADTMESGSGFATIE